MHQSSERIGAIAAALAKAQTDLANPEKTQSAVIRSPFPREETRAFSYASLASGLEIVRKALGRQEIAILQTTRSDLDTGQIQLTTLLAHSSGEWIASEWPVCSSKEVEAPHRSGAALTYARRYALFAMVGIAGEDDLDAPSGAQISGNEVASTLPSSDVKPFRNIRRRQPILGEAESARLRDELLADLTTLGSDESSLVAWARRALSHKQTLVETDCQLIDEAYRKKISALTETLGGPSESQRPDAHNAVNSTAKTPPDGELAIPKSRRVRSRAHLDFVRAQPCVVCQQRPCDPHHIKFAQPRSLGLKVSDEYTVPLCRAHHRDLHRKGSERAWWADLQLTPLTIASALWQMSPIHQAAVQKTVA
ncbi:ERF family protein [uncultured Bradyrhizobium sp.]|jgi:hypothetical protein|uniref:DUF968 domain-containing protein n=1 Tax=uncultured Bradyrhizobium sp. TaxID=199684 RepID=UPI0026215A0B|nr:ERF family protein [uncultured Bradyrhizobium sp.]